MVESVISFTRDPPRITTLYGGIYYAAASGSVVIDDSAVPLGYQVFGTQFVLATSRALAKNDRIGGYLKFTSVTDKIKFQLASQELAGGLNYQFKPDVLGRNIGMGVDLSKITPTLGNDRVDVCSASLNGSYSF
ncbi:MAG: hypothetical protein H7222_07305 [Methylotenera sp.]|nr:hypothetical protein [Oligoflexia bacterium]